MDHWIGHWAQHRPGHVAVRFEGAGPADRTITYRELDDQITAWVGRLGRAGVGAGDRVCLCALNRPEQIIALAACARLRAILVPLNNRLTVAELHHQLTDAEPVLGLVGDGFGPTVAEAAPHLPQIDLDDPDTGPPDHPAGLQEPVSPDDPLLMVYTSGTTGLAKGAVHSRASLHHTVLNGVAHQDLTADDIVLTVLPLFHVGGLNIQTLPALYVGATVVLHQRFEPSAALKAIAAHRVTQTLFVPAVMEAVIGHPAWPDADLGSLRGLNSGSSVVPNSLIEEFHRRGVPVGQVYGSTETGPTAVVLRYGDGPERVGSCGKAALHTEARIVEPADSGDGGDGGAREGGRLVDVADGQAGELVVRGANLFTGYWRNPEATELAMVDGWYRTGDVARRDPDGFVFIEDRLGDLLISGGENVYPAEVEQVLAQHSAIEAVAVIGRPDDRWGEVPVAVIEVADGHSAPTASDLRTWCADRLARFKQPTAVEVVDELPRTALGKVQKHVLRRHRESATEVEITQDRDDRESATEIETPQDRDDGGSR
jgi:fatty-acyl-CoA synthase